ncbi:MAG: YidC/Oxa1 family membrane protein insertase [Oscillospiraceae bacterium]|nr:YidC/Oxa1 family membrane protein insertase [Oscillospiraceae bacterium]
MNLLNSLLAVPLGYIMKFCYWLVTDILHMPVAYVFALLLFTLITKILMFPLSMQQQKSTAMMAAFNPMIQDIQTRYKNDREKQNEELSKLTTEYGYNPTAGCLPMVINLLIMFGLVEVIYKPLTYMLTLPSEFISTMTERTISLAAEAGTTLASNNRMIETYIIQYVKSNFAAFSDLASTYGPELTKIQNLQMNIGSINLYEKPELKLSLALLIPIFSIVTQLLSTVIIMKSSGTQDGAAARQTRSMMITSSLMFAWFSFLYPLGFSLYWGFQNLLTMLQSLLLKKMYDPEEMKKQIQEQIKQKKKQKNAKRKVTYTDKETGKTVEKELSANEADRLRLQRAREIDQERYGDE